MSVVKRIIKNNIERVKVDELLAEEYEQAGYGGIQLTKTPLGAQINLFAMRPGRVIGKRGRAIKQASERLENEIGLPNPQITVIEVEVPELNPQIMASRVANALERGVHFRRAIFWSLRRIMDSGALGCEIVLKGPLRSARSRFEKVVEGYVPKSGDPALKHVKSATLHVKMKRGTLGVTVNIVAPDAKFPDKVSLEGLPDIEYQLPIEEPVAEPAPEVVEVVESTEAVEESITEEPAVEETVTEEAAEPVITEEAEAEVVSEQAAEPVEEPAVEEPVAVEPVVEEAAEPEAVEEPTVEEAVEVEETPEEPVVEEAAVEEPVVEETPEPEPVEEPTTEETPEATIEEPTPEPELVSEPEPELEPEVVEEVTEPEVKPKPEADKVEEAPEEPESEEETE
jgi:small subunit ribosomal protein S3